MIRNEVAWLYHELGQQGLIVGSAGNVSARTEEGMLITPSGGDPNWVGTADLASIGMDGTPHDDVTASSEWALHAAVYRICPRAG
jgi:L-fuculose-phosphate aldolase